jgi:Na+-transporting methylmalonyl-CoA/oxaloacetate decarboxylase gamma subunit
VLVNALAAAASQSTSAWDEPGTLGFLVVFGMAVILYFVFRSMSRHLRKVNESARAEAAQTAAAQTAAADGTSTLADGTVVTSPSGDEVSSGR